jgi:putative copper export protein/methionine-rich copper-binding protein CopC
VRIALSAALLTLVALAVWTSPASAHAVVVSSNPEADSHVATPPKDVSVVFNEPVSISLGGLTVLDSSGRRVDTGRTTQPQPETIKTRLANGLGDGTYVANYAITSADGHAIRGSIIFGVGKGALGDVSGLSQRTDPWLDLGNKSGQFLTYLGVLAAAGLAFFCAFIARDDGNRRRLVRACRWFVALAVIGVVLTVATQAALESGNGLGSIFDGSVLRTIGGQGLGWQTALQAVGLVLCLCSLTARRTVVSQVLALYGGLIATGAFVAFGHALQSSNRWLTVPADVVHVAVASVWLGGLIGLIVVLRQQSIALRTAEARRSAEATSTGTIAPVDRADVDVARHAGDEARAAIGASAPAGGTTMLLASDDAGPTDTLSPAMSASGNGGGTGEPADGLGHDDLDETLSVVGRFSAAAAISIVLLTVAGLVLGVVQVGSLTRLFTTSYGQLLLAKLAIVAVILAMAAFNRYRLLPALGVGSRSTTPVASDRRRWRSLRRAITFETLGIVAVLGVTAVLTNTATSASLPPKPTPFTARQAWDSGSIRLHVTPNAAGANSFSVQFEDAKGAPVDPVEGVSLYLTLPAQGVGPLNKNLDKVGPGHYTLDRIPDLSIPGKWKITLQVRVRDFDQRDIDFTDNVT